MAMRKRRITTIGIFAPTQCSGALVRDARMIDLYQALKSMGFVETRWQYIFDGQIGGLVYPCNNGWNEVHVRFYRDRIFAEFEVSRSSPLHFLCPRFNANKYLIEILNGKVPPESLQYVKTRTTCNLRDDELAQPFLEPNAQPDFGRAEKLFVSTSFASKLGVACHQYIGWRGIVGCAIAICLPISIQIWPPIAVLLALFAVLLWRAVPTPGHP
jgi:hypothetical protein